MAVALSGIWFVQAGRKTATAGGEESPKVQISVAGEIRQSLDLTEDTEYRFENEAGDFNTIQVQEGRVQMKDANCPDKLCIHQGQISKNGETIVCLPHGLVIEIKGGENAAVDLVR